MPDHKPPRGIPVDAVWDIETANWDEFVCGAIWTPSDGTTVYEDENQLADHLLSLSPGATAWAHAGGKFDVLWLLDWCRRNDCIPKAQIRLSGSSIASLSISRGPVLRDSARLMPMSLREACTMFDGCAQKERLDFPCVCGDNCGGYCSIRVGMSGVLMRRLKEYLEADIHSLRDTLICLSQYAEESELLLSGTVASTAWRTAKERCKLDDAEWNLQAYKLARAGYYGGLCAVRKTRAPTMHRFDRRSAYPAELCKPVPCGHMRVLDSRTASMAWNRDKPGIYHATVDVPERMNPPLPLRTGERLVYPWGRFEGHWPSAELRYAIECGVKIKDWKGGIAWSDEEPRLKPHVEHCFSLREKASAKSLKTWLKFIANSLTGAFAQNPEQDVVAIGDYADDPRWEPVGRYDWIWRRQTFRISQRAHVHWAATLTGGARVELNRQIDHAGDDWAYSDTDSCNATRELTRNIGVELGQWAAEGVVTNWRAIAPKVYSYDDSNNKQHTRAKGIPQSDKHWSKIIAGEQITLNRGVDSLLVAARGEKLFQRRDGRRSVKPKDGWVGARILRGDTTYAPSVKELETLPR
jgi:hypothetical protein